MLGKIIKRSIKLDNWRRRIKICVTVHGYKKALFWIWNALIVLYTIQLQIKVISFDGHNGLDYSPLNKDTESGNCIRLFLISFLALFVELSFIRFIPAYVRVVGYYTNIVLIASFLGLGIGFLLSSHKVHLERLTFPLLLLTVLAVWFFSHVVVSNPDDTSEPLWLFYGNSKQWIEMPIEQP